jgi:hypothetical protein
MRQNQEVRFFDDGDRQLLQLRRQRAAHQAGGVAAAHRRCRQPSGDQLARQFVGALAALVHFQILRAQHVAHRVAELEADRAIEIAEMLAVPFHLAAFAAQEHVGVDVHTLAGIDVLAARIFAQLAPVRLVADRERAVHRIGFQLRQAALPRDALEIEMHIEALLDQFEQLEIQAAALLRAPRPHVLRFEAQAHGFLRCGGGRQRQD